MKYFLSILTFLTFCFYSNAQIQPCSSASVRKQLEAMNPALKQKRASFRQQIFAAMNYAKSVDSTDTFEFTIPIVFHIIHQYGTENVSDQQIYNAVQILNEDYNLKNADTTEVVPYYDSLMANCHIQFKLATLDPAGNPTNGITRKYIHSSYSEIGENYDFTKYDRWPTSQYLNVWLVASMAKMGGTAGYAYHPAGVEGAARFRDGVLILHNFVGAIGTGSPRNSRSLTHEIGHYLGLDHVWGGSNEPAQSYNCAMDDGIADTPNCIGSEVGFCDLERSTCGNDTIPDPVQNYMDYSYCSMMFSKGQKSFMRNVLRQNTAYRNSLWQEKNLAKTIPSGVVFDPIPDFYVQANTPFNFNYNNIYTCIDRDVTFTNSSWRLLGNNTTYQWKFEDATPSTSTAVNPTVKFTTPGWKDVTLTVTDHGRTKTITKKDFIYVSKNYGEYAGVHQFNFSDGGWGFVSINPEHHAYEWTTKSDAGVNGSGAIFLDMTSPYTNPIPLSDHAFFNQKRAGSVSSFITPVLDFSKVTNPSISFDWACATSGTTPDEITERLKVYYSMDFGKTWIPIPGGQIDGLDLVNNGTGWGYFYPNSTTKWDTKTLNLGSLTGQSHVVFRFSYFGTAHSNNIALDNIDFKGTLGVNAQQLQNTVTVYPNPGTQSTGWNVKYDANLWGGATIQLTDLSGRIVTTETLPNNQSKWNLNTSNLTKGVYILKIQTPSNIIQKKLILQ